MYDIPHPGIATHNYRNTHMPSVSTPATSPTREVDLAISGMSCGHCVAAVRDALEQVPGVAVQQVAIGTASVALDPASVSTATVVAAVQDAGYDARIADRPLPQAAGTSCCSPRSA